MSMSEFLRSIAVIVFFMGVAALLELVVPLFAAAPTCSPSRRRANLGMMAQTLLFNSALMTAAGALALLLPLKLDGLMARVPMPFSLQVLLGTVVLDFSFGYFAHRFLHHSPFLWRFHRVHHSDSFVDVTTTYRTHPVESVWRSSCLLVPIALLGIPAAAVVIYRLLAAVNGIFEHANLRLPTPLDTMMSSLWVTPNMHKVHHSRVTAETDTNYGNLLSVYDRAFGTFTPSARALTVEYGLEDADDAKMRSMKDLLVMPWA